MKNIPSKHKHELGRLAGGTGNCMLGCWGRWLAGPGDREVTGSPGWRAAAPLSLFWPLQCLSACDLLLPEGGERRGWPETTISLSRQPRSSGHKTQEHFKKDKRRRGGEGSGSLELASAGRDKVPHWGPRATQSLLPGPRGGCSHLCCDVAAPGGQAQRYSCRKCSNVTS